MALQFETVAIPVAKGIDVDTPARLVDAQELLEAQNVRMTAGAGARKRRGHTGQRIRGAKAIPAAWTPPQFTLSAYTEAFSTDERNLPVDWLLGYGNATIDEVADPTVALGTSGHPDGLAMGMSARDNETLVWDGNRLLSRTNLDIPGGQFSEFNAVMPVLRSEPFSKSNVAQTKPDVADNGTIRVATWINNGRPYYSVFDSLQNTAIVSPTALFPIGAVGVRAVPVGDYVHVFVADNDTRTLYLFSVHRSTPSNLNVRSMGDCTGYFDVWKVSESSFVLAMTQPTDVVKVRFLNVDGSVDATRNWNAGNGETGLTSVAICVHPTTNRLCVVWRHSAGGLLRVRAGVYDDVGNNYGVISTVANVTATNRAVAVAPKYLCDDYTTSSTSTSGSGGTHAGSAGGGHGPGVTIPVEELFNVYWDDYNAGLCTLGIARISQGLGITYTTSKFHMLIGSKGFRCGDRTFIWASRNSTYQNTWLLLDETLNPVGRSEYVEANTAVGTENAYTNFSVNWTGTAAARNRSVFHFALSTRVRVPVERTTAGVNAPAVYTEPYIKFAKLDFLPPFRSAQAGRAVYFAGAQLWSYDGAELTEADFLVAPEGVTVASSTAVGSLETTGIYTYRVDLCYRTAQNEEIRSASFYTDAITLTGQSATRLTIPTALTRRSNAYFLIFRNENHGTVWYLCNSRDPSSANFLRNDQTVSQVTYTDLVSDASLITREQHPNQSFEHLDPNAPPSCEVISAGRDRLWLAGGEIAPGQIYPSRLFSAGEVPSFNADLAIEVDRSAEAITAVGFVGDYTVFFRRTHSYILDNDGPDNEMNGDWNKARRSASLGISAISQESVAECAGGIIFQSPTGIRLFGPGGEVVPIGQPVDALSTTLNIRSTVVIGKDQEVRFYCWDGTSLVYNYQFNSWSTWNIYAAGAVRDPQSGLAVVATPQGDLLRETEGVWTDNSHPYKMRVRFSWLRAGNLLDWQQVIRIGAVGESHGNHSIHVDVFYNEREFAEEWFDWVYPDAVANNNDTFGSLNFGDGNFGDDSAVKGINFRDSTWPWRRRLFRRKCSVISVAVDDNYTNGEGFTLTALTLQIAKKPGLDRIPWHGGTFNNTGSNGSSNTGN
jgi:hypothetical protein